MIKNKNTKILKFFLILITFHLLATTAWAQKQCAEYFFDSIKVVSVDEEYT